MNRRALLGLCVWALLAASCNSELGLDQPNCTERVLNTHVLASQAVPTAKYTPCINELRLGWDTIEWYARSGEAGIKFSRGIAPFLTVEVTDSCDVSEAAPRLSAYPDIDRFESVEFETVDLEVIIIPAGEPALAKAAKTVGELGIRRVEERPVVFTIDGRIDQSIKTRVDEALERDKYVWIISSLDAEEGTVEMRSNNPIVSGSGLKPGDALEIIEDNVPDLFYRGQWYFEFEGGCITYEFDAQGILAATVAQDADEALGFYPAYELRNYARDAGFDID